MRIGFVMPARSPVPIGGFVVVYELANRLVGHGHAVTVVHPRTPGAPRSPRERATAAAWTARYRLQPTQLAPWFELDPRVELVPVSHLDPGALPAVDALVATTWETAVCVDRAAPGRGAGFYFVQGYDVWFADAEAVRATLGLPLHKIVISAWLEEMVAELGEAARTDRVPIGLDQGAWGVDVEPAARGPRVGALLNPKKGMDELIEALELLRDEVPGLGVACYGTEAAADVPDWIEYRRLPDRAALRGLYNSCAVFVQASREEGWGLPACEAMACGCALVTYDNGGSREYAIDGETARVVAPGAANLAAAAAGLLRDEPLRLRLADAGRRRVEGFTWERSVEGFEAVLRDGVGAAVA